MKISSRIGAIILVVFLGACSENTSPEITAAVVADTVFINGKIYTIDTDMPWVDALAVQDGKIIARGSQNDISQYVGNNTQTIDLNGKMAMPGINDAHSHLYGGLKEIYYCLFPAEYTPPEVKVRLTECVSKAKDGEFIMGGYWVSSFFDIYDIPSPRAWLDEISADKPIILADDSGHNSWVNSKALADLNYTKESADPISGTIVRDADGVPNGLLFETASGNVEAYYDSRWTVEQQTNGMKHALDLMASFGMTGVKDASMRLEVLKVFHNMDVTEGLTAYIAAAQHTPYGARLDPLDYDYYSENAKTYRSENLDPNFIKFFLDGVPTSSRSAAMTTPYAPDPNHPHAGENKGMLHLSGEDFYKEVAEMDRRGFTIKIHAAGDRSVHEALEAYAYARKVNGNKNKMHEIAHAGYIIDDDLARFSALNVSPDISPYLWFPSPIIDNIVSVLGERGLHYWPNKTLLNLGSTITAGSDWPSVSPTISPWPGIEATITRKHPSGKADGVLWPEERLTLEETLRIFTINGAKALLIEDQAGSLEVGKNANIIVLKDNLFDIPAEQIGETTILQTWYKGKKVYNAQ